MTKAEDLTLKLADDVLTEAEAAELDALLIQSGEARRAHVQLLRIEACLRGTRQDLDLVPAIMARLRSNAAESVTQGVMEQIRAQPRPPWLFEKSVAPVSDPRTRQVLAFPRPGRAKRWTSPRFWLPLAACLALLVCLSTWYFGPTMGKPVLAEVRGTGLTLERNGRRLPATTGTHLRPGDTLLTSDAATAEIDFGRERTRLTLQSGTEFGLGVGGRGKRFGLHYGKLEASVARQRPFHPMIITTPQAKARVVGTRFTLAVTTDATRLEVAQGAVRLTRSSDGEVVNVPAGHYAVAATNYELAALPLTGGVLREYWTNIAGVTLQDLITHASYPDRPDGAGYLTNLSSFEMSSNQGDNYGERLRGYVHPPTTGEYTFWIAGRDDAALWLSPDESPDNKLHMAHSKSAAPADWDSLALQRSAAVPLVGGERYYFEVLHKAGVGDDNLALAWQGPGREREIIPIRFFSPFKAAATERKR